MKLIFKPLATLSILLFFVGGISTPHITAQPLDGGDDQAAIRSNTFKFVSSSNTWTSFSYDFVYNTYSSFRYRFSEDSVQFENQWYLQLQGSDTEMGANWEDIGLFREENGVIYGIYENEEHVFMDFNLVPGDRITMPETFSGVISEFEVIAVDTVVVMDGSQRKRVLFDCYEGEGFYLYWVEGIGLLNHLPGQMTCAVDFEHPLLCFYQNGELIYSIENFESCWLTSVEDLQAAGITVFPNPAIDHLNIELETPSTHPLHFEIIHFNGAVIKSFSHPGGQSDYRIHIDDLQAGIYHLSWEFDGRPFAHRFVVGR